MKPPRYYPLYLDITRALCAVIGGGPVAERKVNGLLEAGARVRVVSPTITQALRTLSDTGQIEYRQAFYAQEQLEGAVLVFAATNDREVNAQVARDAGERHLFVNVADAPQEGDFVVPAVVRRGDFCLSISTGGNNPMLAARLQQELEVRFGPEYSEFVELLGRMRDSIQEKTDDPVQRRALVARLLESEQELRALLAAGQAEQAYSRAQTLIAQPASAQWG